MKTNPTLVGGVQFPLAFDSSCAVHYCLTDTGHAVCIPVGNWIVAAQVALNTIALSSTDGTSRAAASALLVAIPKVNQTS